MEIASREGLRLLTIVAARRCLDGREEQRDVLPCKSKAAAGEFDRIGWL